MIFRITIEDNDFTECLEIMCDKCKQNLLWDMPKPKDFELLSVTEQNDYYEKFFEFQRWCNVNTLNPNKLTIDEIKLLEERIKTNALIYLEKYQFENFDYFKRYLKVKFLKSFKVKFENGENVYYFPFNNGKWLSQ